MPAPATLLGTKLYIKVGDGASPEVFSHPVMINTDRSLQLSASGQNDTVFDPTAPDTPVWEQFFKTAMSAKVSGSGKLDTASVSTYTAWLASGTPKNVKIYLDTTLLYTGAFHLTEFQISGPGGTNTKLAEVSLSLTSHGALS
ncbi:MAG: hypothetical protein JO256_06485 [Alphaproteobacteria bacterium]|nr:hypothetical protein [Alphaproteobacteria bacterium]